MVRRFGITLAALTLLVGAEAWASCCATKTACATVKYQPRRSDSRHKLRQVVGLTSLTHRNNHEVCYGTMSFTPGFMSSFQPEHVARHLFGGDLVSYDNCPGRTIKIQGSAITGRHPNAWLADYFYLPRTYDGTFTVTPRVKTFFVDLDLYLGLDRFLCNSYLRIYGPFISTRWDLGYSENATYHGLAAAQGDYPAGYFTQAAYESGRLLRTFSEYACGSTPQASDNAANNPAADDDNNTPVTFTGLKYAKMCCHPMRRNGFADLRFELGWNAFERERWHLGFNLQGAAPTGNEPKPCYLFAPIVGNGHHWEFGVGITGHYDIWECPDGDGKVSAHMDVNITHLFKTKQYRTFDLKGKPNSAYMLAARMGSNPDTNPPNDQVGFLDGAGAFEAAPRQFAFEYQPVANLSTVCLEVSAAAQADVVALLCYESCRINANIGYNFWARTCDKFGCISGCKDGSLGDVCSKGSWALKGDARMFGYNQTTPIPLSATDSSATIHHGSYNADITGAAANQRVDTPSLAYIAGPTALLIAAGGGQINTSRVPITLTRNDLSMTAGRAITHGLFGYLGYTWDNDRRHPYVGIGGSVDIAQHNDYCCGDDKSLCRSDDCDPCCGSTASCLDVGISQWAAWLKCGVAWS